MFRKLKHRHSRRSFYSDQLIQQNSVASFQCELYIPYPSVNELGLGTAGSRDSYPLPLPETAGKSCTVHFCEVPVLDTNFVLTLQDTGQDAEICLSCVLNGFCKGEVRLSQPESKVFQFQQKIGERWRPFVLKFYSQQVVEKFQTKLNDIVEALVTPEKPKQTYVLLAVHYKGIYRSSIIGLEPDAEPVELQDLPPTCEQVVLISTDTSGQSESNFIPPPFDLATHIPGLFAYSLGGTPPLSLENSKELELTRFDEKKDKDYFNSSESVPRLPSEEPQRLESLLRSIERDRQAEQFVEQQTSQIELTHFDEKKDKDYLNSSESVPRLPSEEPQRLESLLKSIERERQAEQFVEQQTPPRPHTYSTYANDTNEDECLNSEFLPTEELYIKMGTGSQGDTPNKSVKNPKQEEVQKLAVMLQAAINEADVIKAQDYAKKLASANVTVTISAAVKSTEDKEFSLKVYVEDKESSGLSIQLKVRASDTIQDLKNRMFMKNMFPVEVQRWIIGKRIPGDTETLAQCKVRSDGNTAFLYLVSAKSVGISQEEFMRQHTQPTESTYTKMSVIAAETLAAGVADPLMYTPQSARPKEPKVPDVNLNASLREEPLKPQSKLGRSPKHVYENTNLAFATEKGKTAEKVIPNQSPLLFHQAGNPVNPHVYGGRQPVESEEEQEPEKIGWACTQCTFINQPTRPGCKMCTNPRPLDYQVPEGFVISEEEKIRLEVEHMVEQQTKEEEERQRRVQLIESQKNFLRLQQTDSQDIIPNLDIFDCPICLEEIDVGEGVTLRECLHSFCRDCLRESVIHNEQPMLICPYQDESYACNSVVTDREIKAVVSPAQYEKYLSRSLMTAESQASNSFHCKSTDCQGWCIYEDHVNFFVCPVCQKENCLTCKAIHEGMNCKQYQDDLKARAINDRAASQTQIMIKKMLDEGDAMHCPKCKVTVMKKEGCDWIQCSICKTEICWVTKGPRWGPKGAGDISGGCLCRVNNVPCHQDCNNCH